MYSQSFGTKRERDDDESKSKWKQPMVVKEEQPGEARVPNIAKHVGESLSKASVPERRANLAAGRLPGENADGTWLAWPEWCGGRYYDQELVAVMKELAAVEAVIKAEASKVSVQDAAAAAAAAASPYEVLRPVLIKMLKPRRCYTAATPTSCPFCLEGITEIEERLGPEVFEPLARDLEWPDHKQQGVIKCLTCCPHKMKKGWRGLYAHAQGEKVRHGHLGGAPPTTLSGDGQCLGQPRELSRY